MILRYLMVASIVSHAVGLLLLIARKFFFLGIFVLFKNLKKFCDGKIQKWSSCYAEGKEGEWGKLEVLKAPRLRHSF
jgi:hypothetical protein